MKKIFITTVTILFAAIGMSAAITETAINNEQPFVFVESGIEIALFKDGQLVHFIERHHIEGRTADMIAQNLKMAFDSFC